MSQPPPPRRFPGWVEFGQLLGLCGFAFAQPLLDLLARFPQFLRVHEVDWATAGLVVALLFLVPPVVLFGVEWILPRRWRVGAHRFLLSLLVGLTLLSPLGRVVVPVLAIGIVVASMVAVWLLFPRRLFRQALALSPLAVVVFLGAFFWDDEVVESLNTFAPESRPLSPVAAPPSTAPVVLVVFDALPLASLVTADERIDAELFPNFARVAQDAIWFRNHTTVAEETSKALPAILSGLLPGPNSVDAQTHNVFTLLRESHRVHAIEPISRLLPRQLDASERSTSASLVSTFQDLSVLYAHVLLPKDWTGGLARVDQGWRDFGGLLPDRRLRAQPVRMARAFRNGVDEIAGGERPGLHLIHVVLPHDPFVYYPSGLVFSRTGREPSGQDRYGATRDDDDWAAVHSLQRHLLQVGFADRLLGELVDRLQSEGLYRDAMLIVTADHGVSFRTRRNGRAANPRHPSDVLLTPLLVKLPQGTRGGEVNHHPATSIDVLPTLAAGLGLTLPWDVDGRSLLGPEFPARPFKKCWTKTDIKEYAADRAHELDETRWRAQLRGDLLWRPGPFGSLVGTRVESLPSRSPVTLPVQLLSPTRTFDRSTGEIPSEVEGLVKLDPGQPTPWLAIEINGRIGAVTKPYQRTKDRPQSVWSALIPEEFFRAGENELALWNVDADGQLRPIVPGPWQPNFLGQRLGRELVVGVEEVGFHKRRNTGRDAHRWTAGAARLVVPLHQQRPRRVRIELNETGPAPAKLTVRANGEDIFAGTVGPERWTESFPLDLDEGVESLELELLSTHFLVDGKPLGVAVRGIWVH